jgi:two-component system OmpR family response regulator
MTDISPAVPNVMLAEENDEIRSLLTDFLEASGYAVTVFPGPEDLETALGGQDPDFILMNVGETNHTGLAVLQRIRSVPRFDAVPIVMLSGEKDDAVTTKCASMGADGVFTWPYSAQKLRENIEALLAGESIPLVIAEEDMFPEEGSVPMD